MEGEPRETSLLRENQSSSMRKKLKAVKRDEADEILITHSLKCQAESTALVWNESFRVEAPLPLPLSLRLDLIATPTDSQLGKDHEAQKPHHSSLTHLGASSLGLAGPGGAEHERAVITTPWYERGGMRARRARGSLALAHALLCCRAAQCHCESARPVAPLPQRCRAKAR